MLAFLQAHKLNKNNYHLCLHCLKFIVYCSQFEAHLFMTPRSCSIRIGKWCSLLHAAQNKNCAAFFIAIEKQALFIKNPRCCLALIALSILMSHSFINTCRNYARQPKRAHLTTTFQPTPWHPSTWITPCDMWSSFTHFFQFWSTTVCLTFQYVSWCRKKALQCHRWRA